MTAHGSEETAIQALRKGATNYVAEAQPGPELVATVEDVLAIAGAGSRPAAVLPQTEARSSSTTTSRHPALLEQLEDRRHPHAALRPHRWMRIAVALREAVVNAIYHGNLELTSQLREEDDRRSIELAEQRPRGGRLRRAARPRDRARDPQRA